MKKIIITNRQLMILVSGYMFGSAPLLISSSVASLAGPDSWLSLIIAGIAGLLVVWLNTYLGGLFPDKTLAEVISFLLGKWFGGLLNVLIVFAAMITGTQVIWYVGDFFTTVFMPEYPTYPINVLFIAIIAIAMLYGLEAMARAIEIFFMVGFPLLLLSFLMLSPEIKVENLLPMLEKGIVPAIKGTIPLLSLTVIPLIALNLVYPINIEDVKCAKKSIFKGYLLGTVTTFIAVMMAILTLGSTVTANLRFPLFTSTKLISLGTVFSRIEAIVVFVWIITNFIATFFYFYGGFVTLSQLLKLKSYKTLVLPLLLICSAYSDTIYKNIPYEIEWDSLVWIPFSATYGILMPAVLLIIAKIKRSSNKGKNTCQRKNQS